MNSSDESPVVVELPDDAIEALIAEAQAKFWTRYIGILGPLRRTVKFVAARVRAEAVAGGVCSLRLYADHLARLGEPGPFVEGHRHAAVILSGMAAGSGSAEAADRIAEAVAAERQRIAAEIRSAKDEQVRSFGNDPGAYFAGRVDGLEDAARIVAAGSVPVATPPAVCGDRVRGIGDALLTCDRMAGHRLPHSMEQPGSQPATWRSVATPTEPDGAALIATERRRQVTTEGYTPEHDAECERDGQLAAAAAAYCLPFTMLTMYEPGDGVPSQDQGVWHPACWPWAVRYWKPTPDDRVRELVKAGALIAAEIDRLLAASPVPAVPDDLGSLQRQAIAARARGDFAAERAALDRIIVLERSPVPVEQPEPKGVAGHAPGCDGWRPPTALGFGRSIPERCKPGCPRSEQPETAVYVTPGHPTVAGPGYNCGCGQCLHARRSPAGQLEER